MPDISPEGNVFSNLDLSVGFRPKNNRYHLVSTMLLFRSVGEGLTPPATNGAITPSVVNIAMVSRKNAILFSRQAGGASPSPTDEKRRNGE